MPDRSSVLAVVVVYQRPLDTVVPWPGLREWLQFADDPSRPDLARIVIYDNSAQPMARPRDDEVRCTYLHDPSNGGTARAYAAAAQIAADAGIEWMLLLDHDTSLPREFLVELQAALHAVRGRPDVAALLPRVRQRATEQWLSPVRLNSLGTMRPLRPGQSAAGGPLSALASGSLLHVPSLRQLLPLPAELWLDYVDHWIFARLRAKGLQLLTFDAVLEHDLSIMSPGTLTERRLRSILSGERRFHTLLGRLARMLYPLRLAQRLLLLALVNPALALQAVRWLAIDRAREP